MTRARLSAPIYWVSHFRRGFSICRRKSDAQSGGPFSGLSEKVGAAIARTCDGRTHKNDNDGDDNKVKSASLRRFAPANPVLLSLIVTTLGSSAARAFEIEGWSDAKIRWDNTVKYTAAVRTSSPDLGVANQNGMQPNTDFGDLGNRNGLINNRLDLLSEFDLKYQDVGFRVSGAYWYDRTYARSTNDFNGEPPAPNTQAAAMGGPNNAIPRGTYKTMGQRAELMDAFVFGRFDVAGRSLSVRAGQHTLLYGESLFLGMNGIAAAQGPVDAIKLLSLPNTQFKEIALPVPQLSGSFEITPAMSVGAYYQFGWRETRIPAAGSYFSAADFLGDGGDLLWAPPAAPGSPFNGQAFRRTADAKGRNSGQFGAQFKFKIGDVDYGLYAARYDAKDPIGVMDLTSMTATSGSYREMYARNIKVFGASFSTVVSETNVAGEISTRRNTPLAIPGDLVMSTIPNADNGSNTPYARGNSLHINLSAISVFGGNGIWGGASFVGELGYNRLLNVTYRPSVPPGVPDPVNSNATRDEAAMRLVFTPTFFQVLPNVDLDVPIGIGVNLFGRSPVVQMSPWHGGDITFGLNATIHHRVKVGLNYTHFFGPAGTANSPVTAQAPNYASYRQYYKDRDFVALTVQTTF